MVSFSTRNFRRKIRFNSLSKHNQIILLTISMVVNDVFFFREETLHRLEGRKYVKVSS